MNAAELAKVEARYQRAVARADEARLARNAAIHDALEAGMSQREIAESTGLTRGRVSQLAMLLERVVTYSRPEAS